MKIYNRKVGSWGERVAADYLKKKKYKIICQNYSNKIGEIDIIARDKKCIVFVEVKTRLTTDFGLPREAVDEIKQQKIQRTALSFLSEIKELNVDCRYDVIEILGFGDDYKIEHIENAF